SWLTDRLAGPQEPAPAPAPATASAALAPAGRAPRRHVLREVALPAPGGAADLAGARFAVLGGGAVADALGELLTARGAAADLLSAATLLTERDGPYDGVFLLGPLAHAADDAPVLPDSFPVLQAALRPKAPRWLVCARPAGDPYRAGGAGAGLHGLFRTVAREYPDTLARVVALDAAAPPAEVAAALLAELSAQDRAPVVLHTADGRRGLEMAAEDLGSLARTGAGPAADGAAEAQAIGLDSESVVLLTGGARGITAHIALALAAASHCRIELVGRTPLPSAPEEPDVAAAADLAGLRSALARRGGMKPVEVDRAARLVLAQREIAATLEELRRVGGQAAYRCLDVRDGEAVHQAVKEIHAEHGRLDGVVYGAGVIEDRLIADKSPESFRRVFGTKVDGARTLLDAVSELSPGPRFAVLFGSIAAVLGNRGQSDYAAANDALEAIGASWAARTGRRAVTVHWGPWAPTGAHGGMVTPELGQEYARRGIELIDPDEGALALLRELAWGDPSATGVVHTASGW
ncbi:SDR family NAD(P)-dependent oxidoreductase, partial [Streptomyces sp. B1866]|uniref:SDR family NAD(P)-dependent oxidoreductase n=1 Tax=Streptomyces sp. B1866 TaxID=3075431 RepID=UPI00288E892A